MTFSARRMEYYFWTVLIKSRFRIEVRGRLPRRYAEMLIRVILRRAIGQAFLCGKSREIR